MEQNQIAHDAFAAAATDEPAAFSDIPGSREAAPPADTLPGDDPDFASEEEAVAYWQGVADGIRQSGNIVPPRLAARLAREEAGLLVPVHGDNQILPGTGRGTAGEAGGGGGLPASFGADAEVGPLRLGSAKPPSRTGEDRENDILAFAPTHLRHRHDGWTPEKQIAFVEALAETGIVRKAAAEVGMDQRSVSRLRRRADARAFDRACTAAARIGARNLVSIAYERAIEGTIKRHYFHGELKAEERVYDNRLLIALIARLPKDEAPAADTKAVEQDWDGWMSAIAEGRDVPAPASHAEPIEYAAWEDVGGVLTNCPPPPGFDGMQDGVPGHPLYQRLLSQAEHDWWENGGEDAAWLDHSRHGEQWLLDGPDFFLRGCGLSGLSEGAEPEEERSEANDSSGESRPGSADGSAPAEPDRRHGFAGTPQPTALEHGGSTAPSPSSESPPAQTDGTTQAELDRPRNEVYPDLNRGAETRYATDPQASAQAATGPAIRRL